MIFIAASGQKSLFAASTSGTTNLTINIPEFIVLHYSSSVVLNFEEPTGSSLINEGPTTFTASWDGATDGSGVTPNVTQIVGDEVTVTLPNIWGVRGFSHSGNARVSITVPGEVGENSATGSKIRVNGAEIEGPETVSLKRRVAAVGGVVLGLDLTQLTTAGSHQGIQLVVTATTV